MSDGYTYTTVSAHTGRPVTIAVSFHLDASAWLAVIDADSDSPHLLISQGDVSASVSPAKPGQVTDEDAQLARTLADKAAAYAEAIERLAAARRAGTAAA